MHSINYQLNSDSLNLFLSILPLLSHANYFPDVKSCMVSCFIRFWLFEPRCGMHDIGGWYVETFGSDKKARTVPSQRNWYGLDANELLEK